MRRNWRRGPRTASSPPNFLLRTTDGRTLCLSDLRGRPVFLDFWATWCVFCIAGISVMQKLADRRGDDVALLRVNGEDAADARRFAERNGICYPLVLDAEEIVRSVSHGVLTRPRWKSASPPS